MLQATFFFSIIDSAPVDMWFVTGLVTQENG